MFSFICWRCADTFHYLKARVHVRLQRGMNPEQKKRKASLQVLHSGCDVEPEQRSLVTRTQKKPGGVSEEGSKWDARVHRVLDGFHGLSPWCLSFSLGCFEQFSKLELFAASGFDVPVCVWNRAKPFSFLKRESEPSNGFPTSMRSQKDPCFFFPAIVFGGAQGSGGSKHRSPQSDLGCSATRVTFWVSGVLAGSLDSAGAVVFLDGVVVLIGRLRVLMAAGRCSFFGRRFRCFLICRWLGLLLLLKLFSQI